MPKSHQSSSILHPSYQISSLIVQLTLLSTVQLSISIPIKPHFDSNLEVLGDAKFTNDISSVQLTDPKISSQSTGILIQKKPIKLFTPYLKSRKPISFSTDFSFSISPDKGNGLAFIIIPKSSLSKNRRGSFGVLKKDRYFAVEFDAKIDANRVSVDAGSLVSTKTSNVSSINLVLNSGLKLHSWIDYDSSSKKVEVRLSKFGDKRPYDPLLVYKIDLGEMWRNEEVLLGLSSSSGNSMQISCVYSWKFSTRSVPRWMHSQPLDPRGFNKENSEEKLAQKKRICALGFLSGLVFMTGCGALLALIVLFLWALLENGSETILTIPGKCKVGPEEFRYEKIDVVVGDESSGAKK